MGEKSVGTKYLYDLKNSFFYFIHSVRFSAEFEERSQISANDYPKILGEFLKRESEREREYNSMTVSSSLMKNMTFAKEISTRFDEKR